MFLLTDQNPQETFSLKLYEISENEIFNLTLKSSKKIFRIKNTSQHELIKHFALEVRKESEKDWPLDSDLYIKMDSGRELYADGFADSSDDLRSLNITRYSQLEFDYKILTLLL